MTARKLSRRSARLMATIAAILVAGVVTTHAADSNSGDRSSPETWGRHVVADATDGMPSGMRVLVAPADIDDPGFRAAVARMIGGTVDYYDARVATPSAAFLSTYDCVFTYPDYAYANNVAMGDNLATAVDNGKTTVVLGSWSVPTAGNSLAGEILTANYCPVMTPTGTGLGSFDSWARDGVPAFTEGVMDFGAVFRDDLATQGNGNQFSTYLDGEIAVASSWPDWRVTYLNGATVLEWEKGDWPLLLANACRTGAFDVLVLDDGTDNSWAAAAMPIIAANYSVVDQSQFNTFLTDPTRDWDLVLVDSPWGQPTGGWDDLIAYANAGGKVVMSFWDWDDSNGYGNPGLAGAFGFTTATELALTPSDTYTWAATSGAAYVHAGVGDLPTNNWSGTWADDGDVFGLASGTVPLGRIVGGAVEGPVVIQNPAGNAIAAFVLDSWGSVQAVELWRNLILRVLGRTDLDGAALLAQWMYPAVGTTIESHEFVVGPTTDLTEAEISSGTGFAINMHGPYILWEFTGSSSFTSADFNGWQFSDLTGELPAIGSAWVSDVDPGVAGLDPHAADYGDDWVRVNLEGADITAPAMARVKVFFGLWADSFETGDTLRWDSTTGAP